ncbi:MAG: Gfo/Idh/MocA family oxidoreductase [Actinomycetota bacterium]|nr:Gfo/Idh/MocA family oxidoreductase [Actinomycetota bacterium]
MITASKPIGVGIIGLGTIAEAVHLPALRRLANCYAVRAVADLSPGRAEFVARRAGSDVLATTDPLQVIEHPGVELVMLLHSGAHGRLCDVALRSGRHVFAEKPLSMSRTEALGLDRLAKNAGVVLQVGYMKMYDPILTPARRALGELHGKRLIRITVLHPDEPHQFAHLRPTVAADDVEADALAAARADDAMRTTEAIGAVPAWLASLYQDVLNGSVIHELSLLRALGLGLPERFEHVRAWPSAPPAPPDLPPCLEAAASLDERTRLLLSWNFLPTHAEYVEELAVFADDGRLELRLAPPYLLDARSSLSVARSEGELRSAAEHQGAFESGFLLQLEALFASIRHGDAVRSSAADAAGDISCLQAMTRALAAGYGVELGGEAAAQEGIDGAR